MHDTASKTVAYGFYSQEELDHQYDIRGHTPEFEQFVRGWQAATKQVKSDIPCEENIAYGPSDMEVLDVYPADSHMPAPVQIFFHGGGWRSMSKEEFGYVARSFHRKGAITLVPNYALLPDTTLDEMVRQCRAAVAWAWNNVHRYGGDRTRIFISGHSAGAHLVSMLATTDWTAYENCWPNIVKGVTAVSGFYELEAARHSSVFRPFLKTNEVARNSPFGKQVGVRTPFIISLGAHESRETHRQSRLYADYLAEIGMPSEHIVVEGHNHYSVLDAFENENHPLGKAVCRQMGLG